GGAYGHGHPRCARLDNARASYHRDGRVATSRCGSPVEPRRSSGLVGRPKTASWVGEDGEHDSYGGTCDRHAAASEAGAAKEVCTTQPALCRGGRPLDAGPVRAPGVPRLSRRLCRPRHGGGACSRARHSRLRIRPKTKSWVGLLVAVRGEPEERTGTDLGRGG